MAMVRLLEAHGIPCWTAPRDIAGGQIWAEAVIAGINSASAFVVLCSEESVRSQQVLREVERAAARSLPLIPVRLSDVQLTGGLEYFLSNAHWIDLFPGEISAHLPLVEAALGRPRPASEPPRQVADIAVQPDQWARKRNSSLFSRFARFLDDKE